jgi:hypothetical protein
MHVGAHQRLLSTSAARRDATTLKPTRSKTGKSQWRKETTTDVNQANRSGRNGHRSARRRAFQPLNRYPAALHNLSIEIFARASLKVPY